MNFHDSFFCIRITELITSLMSRWFEGVDLGYRGIWHLECFTSMPCRIPKVLVRSTEMFVSVLSEMVIVCHWGNHWFGTEILSSSPPVLAGILLGLALGNCSLHLCVVWDVHRFGPGKQIASPRCGLGCSLVWHGDTELFGCLRTGMFIGLALWYRALHQSVVWNVQWFGTGAQIFSSLYCLGFS